MRVEYVILASVAACGFPRPQDVVDDAMADAGNPGPCFGSYVHVCFDLSSDVPTVPQTWPDAVVVDIDTDTSALCNQHNDHKSTYCVVASAGMTLDFGKTVRAHGTKPLVLLSTNTMALAGNVDLGSYRAGVPFRGAGANPPGGCTFTTPPFGATIGGGGGGYGGSFGTRGGDGSNSVPMSGLNGRAGDALLGFPPALRGGCRGGDGGAIAGPEGQGGDGAGAVALIAAQIHIDGRIDASGSGGHGGFAGSGGGGGGSGG